MTDTAINQSTQREPRHWVADGQTTTVMVKRGSGSNSEAFPAKLLDLSRNGVKLSAPSCIRFGEAVSLNLAIQELDLVLNVSAEVCWTRPTEGGAWLIGCSFQPELPQDTLDILAASGQLERRNEPRRPISFQATVRWNSDKIVAPVALIDWSQSGFCMLTAQVGTAGQEVALYLDKLVQPDRTPVSIAAKAQWAFKVADIHLVGCAFLHR